jgi:hypothetical protein
MLSTVEQPITASAGSRGPPHFQSPPPLPLVNTPEVKGGGVRDFTFTLVSSESAALLTQCTAKAATAAPWFLATDEIPYFGMNGPYPSTPSNSEHDDPPSDYTEFEEDHSAPGPLAPYDGHPPDCMLFEFKKGRSGNGEESDSDSVVGSTHTGGSSTKSRSASSNQQQPSGNQGQEAYGSENTAVISSDNGQTPTSAQPAASPAQVRAR